MKFPTIRLEGAVISSEIIEKIEKGEALGQEPHRFGIDQNKKVKDEIAATWADLQDIWRIFKRKTESLSDSDTGNAEARRFWIIPLLNLLGYEPELAKAEEVNGQSYAISHRDNKLHGFPIHMVGFRDKEQEAPEKRSTLDIKPSNASRRMSAHALVQEYINLTEHSYALVTNGLQLRLLRDSSRLTKLSFIEFDLERMLEEEAYTDFAVMFRLLHASRMPSHPEKAPESLIDLYHQDALDAGSRIRDGLSEAVKRTIEQFGKGFLQHPSNEELREKLRSGSLSADKYFQYQLRLIYRLLFIMVIEERDLIFPPATDPKKKKVYYDYYSLNRLRKLAEKPHLRQRQFNDHYVQLLQLFRMFEEGRQGKQLDIAPLGGDIFSPAAIGELYNCQLDNKVLFECLYHLSVFTNKVTGQRIRVNYASLNVEEFGSVYEGLLEFAGQVQFIQNNAEFKLVKGTERSSSGSHYTPDELVQPLIKHSLDYIIEDKLKEKDPEQALLCITVCDVACGSGHILLSAARRIALELAKVRHGEEQPSPSNFRAALRDVIRNCIYGVDLNPLAVELCKVALWLEAHNPGQPLNFLDHHIKCGNAIVGLAHQKELENGIPDEAFKVLPRDEKAIAKVYRDKNAKERKERAAKALQLKAEFEKSTENSVREAMAEYNSFSQLPETTPQEIERKSKAYQKFIDGKGFTFLKAMADTQVAQFFIPKTDVNKDYLMTDADFRSILSGYKGWQDRKVAKATAVALEQRFFHWFIEFPEVFNQGGFDCILGNPPFLGDKKLKSTLGEPFMEVSKYLFYPIGAVDIVTYFFRRIFDIINANGFLSLISTNTIAQGNSREGGLEVIVNKGGFINHAVRSIKWPGKAAVEVAIVSITKQLWSHPLILGNKKVNSITTYLDDAQTLANPFPLSDNQQKSFVGSYILGVGFILDVNEATSLITKNEKNKEVLFPYLNGENLNSHPQQMASRWIINFFDWPEKRMSYEEWKNLDQEIKSEINDKLSNNRTVILAPSWYGGQVANDYPDCYNIILQSVKPDRQRWAVDKDGREIIGTYAVRAPMPERWWIYGEKRPGLYNAISSFNKVLVTAQVSKTLAFSFVNPNQVYDSKLIVFAYDRNYQFSVLQSNFHYNWAWKYCTTMKNDLSYTPAKIAETFPFPQNLTTGREQQLEFIGEAYHEHRRQLMLGMQLGLTKTYNLFHSDAITAQAVDEKDKQVTALRKHLEKVPNTISFNETMQGILKLRELHVQMDESVLDAYGWNDIALRHDFYEVDYLPENDRIRYTIHPDARKEVLKRLLELNHKIHAEEVAAGLWDKKNTPKKKADKGKQNKNMVEEEQAGYGWLFG